MGIAQLFPTTGRNPYVSLLYRELAQLGFGQPWIGRLTLAWLWRARRDVTFLHFSWTPDRYYVWKRFEGRRRGILAWVRLVLFSGRLLSARLLGYRIVWTIHEIYPPSSKVSRRLDRVAGRVLARASHALVAHDRSVAKRARAAFGPAAARIEIVQHGSYAGVYAAGRSRSAVRSDLRLAPDAFVFLCFGKLRADKRIDLLLDAFRAVSQPNAVLLIAGTVTDRSIAREITQAARTDPRIRPMLESVPDHHVVELFAAADAAVLARSEIWTSGSLILALSLGVPVVASQLAPHEELLDGEKAGWLFEPGNAASLRWTLERALRDGGLNVAKRQAALDRAACLPPWPAIAETFARAILATVGLQPVESNRSGD